MARKLLNSLKAGSAKGSSISHEARLGMMIVTILFFAFCFLVYHKMDLHQRQLTQVSIAPTAKEEKAAAQEPSALPGSTTKSSPAADPLVSRTEASGNSSTTALAPSDFVLSGDSQTDAPEADSILAMTETTDEITAVSSRKFDELPDSFTAEVTVPEFSFNEPSESPEDRGESPFTALADASGFAEPMEPAQLSEPVEAETVKFEQFPAISESAVADDFSESTESDLPAFSSLDEPESPAEGLTDLETAAEAPTAGDLLALSDELPVPLPKQDSPINFLITEEPVDSTEDPEPPVESNTESVLLAMAEPLQESEFSAPPFLADDSEDTRIRSPRAPVDDSAEPFPAFGIDDAPSVEHPAPVAERKIGAEQKTAATHQDSPFGNGGFNAVAQPAAKTNRHSTRTAPVSGSTGKFSLAAFNYQNNAVESAPDDGSTFDSVKVQKDDNYSRISKRVYGTTRYFSALAVFNQHRIPEPKYMRPGMIVLTPPKEVLEDRYPQLFVNSKPKVAEPATFLILEDGSPAYRVGERETLSEISQRFLGRSARWIEIYRLNQSVVNDPNKLKVGVILALPEDATEVNLAP